MHLKSIGLSLLCFVLLAFASWPTAAPIQLETAPQAIANSTPFTSCSPEIYTKQLNNYLNQYMDRSVKQGIQPVANTEGLRKAYKAKKLVLVQKNIGYELDTFQYSYAFLTPYAHQILNEIGNAFKDSIAQTHLRDCNLIVTSMTRTKYTVSKLVKHNKTAVKKSPHLNGNSFDFSFSRFTSHQPLSANERQYLQTTISKILLHFKQAVKIWVTYEANEECLHVVARKGV
ncbi:MAG: hypothetical protein RL164_443 [Bacteroidota bacterium]|jgi:hypothetical protein